MNASKNKITLVCLFIGIGLVAIGLFVTLKTKQTFDDSATWTVHTYEVLAQISRIKSLMKDVAIHGIENDSLCRSTTKAIDIKLIEDIHALKLLTTDNKLQHGRIDSLIILTKFLVEDRLRQGNEGALENPLVSWNTGDRNRMKNLNFLVEKIQASEYQLLFTRKKTNQESIALLTHIFIVLLSCLSLFIVFVFFAVQHILKARVLMVKAQEIIEKSLKDVSDYKHALDKSAIVAITDKHGIIKHVNEKFCTISKYNAEELIGQDHRIINSGYHDKEFIRTLWQTIASGKIWKGELKNKAKDGTAYWVDTTIIPFLDEHQKPYQYVAIRADITARKLAEAKFRALIENSFDLVTIVDKDLKTLYRSPGAVRISGWTNEDIEERGNVDLIHPGDIEKLQTTLRTVMDNPGIPFPLTLCTKHKEGHYIFLEGIVTNMLHNESIKGIVSNFKDVTKIRKAEEKNRESEKIYRTVASSIPGSVISLIDKDYNYLLVEGDMVEAMGYSKEKILNKNVKDVIPRERFKEILPHFERVFRGESFTVENFRAGFDVLTRFVPLRNENNTVFAGLVVLFDVSELKRAERKITELNIGLETRIKERTHELERVNKELESFSYSVAHDLRTPLRAINGYAVILKEDHSMQLDDEGKRLLGLVEKNANKMGVLIDDLLAFSKMGRQQMQKSTINMNELIEACLNDLNIGDNYVGKIIVNKLHPIQADASLLRNVMVNLLGNAIKYSSKRENPHIEITSEEKNNEVTYCIKDNGVGFDMQFANKLFGVFQRLHSEKEFEGTGVGLALVHRIILRHNGKIWAESEINKGATFYFSLPILTEP